MSRRARVALFWAALGVLAAAGAYFAVIYEPSLEAPGSPATGGLEAASFGGRDEAALDLARRLRRKREVAQARSLQPSDAGDDAPRSRDLRSLDRERAEAEPVARRFFAVFARYELGGLGPSIETELRSTATARLARELVAAPPRMPRGGDRPAPAALGGLQFVAGEADTRSDELRSAELVGWVERAGVPSPLAIELVRGPEGWRVSGIGR